VSQLGEFAPIPGYTFASELEAKVDAKTLEVMEHRRRTASIRRRGWLVRRALLAADGVGLLVAFLCANLLMKGPTTDGLPLLLALNLFVLTVPIWVVVAKIYGLYENDEERADHTTVDDVAGVFHLVTVGTWLFFVVAQLTNVVQLDLPGLIAFWALAVGAITFSRATARSIARRQIGYIQNTVIVGAGDVGQLLAKKFAQNPQYGINVVGFVDRAPKEQHGDLEELRLLGPPESLPAIVRIFDVERVVVAFSLDTWQMTVDLIRRLKDLDVQVDVVPRLFEIVGPGMKVHGAGGVPLIGLPPARLSRSSRLVKRMLDSFASMIALVCLSPVFVLVALAIKLDSPGPVFFRQVRMGSGGRTFRIWKFRTMSADAEERKAEVVHLNTHAEAGGDPRMFKIPDDPRVTRVGRLLRRTSIDELPQLFNVFAAQMSLVGPRPLILDEDQHVQDWARKRLDLKPGMTGLWQVLGRSDIPFEEMVKFDYSYVTSWSLRNDLLLIARTIPVLFGHRRGSY
jgi:exopolysaccharide biosynthesis polyprenyl glycosylphosphotransferase